MSGKIRGEYWIVDGRVDFADGDIGDQNHEMVALNAVASDHIDALVDYAEELGVEDMPNTDEPFPAASELIGSIHFALVEKGVPSVHVAGYVVKRLGTNMEVYKMLGGGGDARLHMMKTDGWIAVRSNNVELYGYDQDKRKSLADGIEDILDQEGVEEPDEDIELSLYDHRTGRSSDVTLADIKGANPMRPKTIPNTTYNTPMQVPRDKSGLNPRTLDARTRSMLQTSESHKGFRAWLVENHGSFMVRRTWPELVALEMEPPASPASRRSRRGRRR